MKREWALSNNSSVVKQASQRRGFHWDRFVIGANTSSPVTGQKADLLAAAYNAVEAGLRGAKVGSKNWEITDNISKALSEYSAAGVKGVEGELILAPDDFTVPSSRHH